MANMGEFKIFKILRDITILGLNSVGITDDVDVRRFAQANFNHGDKLILLNCIRTSREGWQAFKYRPTDESLKRNDEWLELQDWQFSSIKRMRQEDNEDTISAVDIANSLIAWFNGPGSLELRNYGIANLLIDPTSIMIYNDDSDLYQRRPVFTMSIYVPKSLITDAPYLSGLDGEEHPI